MDTALPFWGWLAFGLVLLAWGTWRDWGLCRAMGVGGAISGLVIWGMENTPLWHQLVLFVGLSLLSWIGGRRMQRLDEVIPAYRASGFGVVGRAGVVEVAFARGRGRVRVGGQSYDARADDDLPLGANVQVVGRDDESLKVAARRVLTEQGEPTKEGHS